MQRANAALVEMSMSRPLYERLMAVRKAQIPPALRYMLNRQLGAYRRAGVDKDETTRKRIAELQNRINAGISSFDRNIAEEARSVAATPAELKGMTPAWLAGNPAGTDGMVRGRKAYPDARPRIHSAESAETRK